MLTCEHCFNLRHHKCRGCGCSVCARPTWTPRPTRKPITPRPTRTPTLTMTATPRVSTAKTERRRGVISDRSDQPGRTANRAASAARRTQRVEWLREAERMHQTMTWAKVAANLGVRENTLLAALRRARQHDWWHVGGPQEETA